MNRDEKISNAEIKTDSKAVKWFDNFWYHYKWVTIIVLFFIIVFTVCTLQMCSTEKEDITIIYAGPIQLSDSEILSVESIMDRVLPEDFDGNGKKYTALRNYQIFSEEQIKKIESETDSAGVNGYVDRSYNSSNYTNFYNYIQTGDVSICLLDRHLFDSLCQSDRIMYLSDVLENVPEGAVSGRGIEFGNLGIYDAYGAMKIIPEDTVLCILRPLVAGKNSKEEMYANEKKMFDAIIKFNDEK